MEVEAETEEEVRDLTRELNEKLLEFLEELQEAETGEEVLDTFFRHRYGVVYGPEGEPVDEKPIFGDLESLITRELDEKFQEIGRELQNFEEDSGMSERYCRASENPDI